MPESERPRLANIKSTPTPDTSVSWPRGLIVRVVAAILGGLILRVWMMTKFPQGSGDSLIYADLARNVLQHGQFAITDGSGVIHSTLIRLPGYPIFLLACFRLFGVENLQAVAYFQIALELCSCLLLADFVRRITNTRAGLNTLWLATMCPFTAVYASAPLTESLTFDTICLALWSLQRYLSNQQNVEHNPSNQASEEESTSNNKSVGNNVPTYVSKRGDVSNNKSAGERVPDYKSAGGDVQNDKSAGGDVQNDKSAGENVSNYKSAGGNVQNDKSARESAPNYKSMGAPGLALETGDLNRQLRLILFTISISAAAMLRPDGAILAIALWPALLFSRNKSIPLSRALRQALLCGLISVIPFAAWAARNWSTFHVFEPLATRYANDPGEDPHLGWQHWVKTWCIDFTCTEEIYWNVPDGPLDFSKLPGRAFDSAEQRQQTADLVTQYAKQDQQLDLQPGQQAPSLDDKFEALAQQRYHDHPMRNYVLLPAARLADMTLRPRVENLTIDLRWWEYHLHRQETRFSWTYAAVSLLFVLLGIAGLFYRPRFWPYLVAYLFLRSLLLLTVEAPETRYTLEFFPILFATGGIALWHFFRKRLKPLSDSQSESRQQA